MANDCIFCRIKSGEIKSDIVYTDEQCFIIKDIAPKAPVHLLVIPNKHFTYLTGLTVEENEMIGGMFRAAAETARKQGIDKTGYRLVINQGANSGQQVPHLHLHILAGRQMGMMA
ncbi:MAG: histidine triad nucleotide-binding protein [SAR202 cluster bacterium]|nr:histidine triad nucleotide-binding protein [SAR202 cluster bacterium]